jgi:hypothetical protein
MISLQMESVAATVHAGRVGASRSGTARAQAAWRPRVDLKIIATVKCSLFPHPFSPWSLRWTNQEIEPWSCWWPNLISLKKLDYSICYSGTSAFGSFKAKPRKMLNSKIWRSNIFWSKKRGSKASRDQDRRKSSKKLKLQKSDHPDCQTGVSGFPRIDRV